MEGNVEIVIAGLLLAISALVTAARVLNIPYPIFLVIGGLAIGFVPGMPEVELDPELALLIFLPPLLYYAAFVTSLRDLRRNLRPISLLAVGLVLATCIAVAAVAHAVIDGLSWEAAFVLGAIVSPTDPVAATAIASRIGVPKRVVQIVEGESLVNDATALVAYKVAVAAVVTGSFSLLDAAGRFVYAAIGGVLIGLAVGWCVAWVRARLDDPPVEITISILTAYLAYLPAEELGLSGVMAAVTVGLYMGSQTWRLTNPVVRMQTGPVWQILVFLLNSFLFVLIGLQLPGIVDGLREGETPFTVGELLLYAAAVSLTVIVVRMVWTFVFTYTPGIRYVGAPDGDPVPPPRDVAVVAWMGMRGAVSLAAALALPLATNAGTAFPGREVITFVAYGVIMVTLVLQGLTLPALIRLLGVRPDDWMERQEENVARLAATRAALERLDELQGQDWTRAVSVDRARRMLEYRHRRFEARFDAGDDGGYEDHSDAFVRMSREIIDAQRHAIEALRRDGVINDEVMRRVERDLDLEEVRLNE